MYLVLMKSSHLFLIGWSDFWLDSLIQKSIAHGDGVNISDIKEVLTRHQYLAGNVTLNTTIKDLCLEIFKGYQPIVDWLAKKEPDVLEVWL